MKIYLDLLLIQDTIVIAAVLFATSKIIEIKISFIKILIISLISTIISIAILVFIPTLYDNLLIKFLISYFIVKFGFKANSNINLFQEIIIFWIVSFMVGGISIGLNGNIFLTIVFLIISILLIISYKQKNRKKLLLMSATCEIKFYYLSKMYIINALIDTGHDVKTMFNEDVIFIRADILKNEGGGIRRLVSYKTIAGMESKPGIKINNICITYNNKEIFTNAVFVRSNNILQDFDAIVGFDLIQGGILDGNTYDYETKSKEIIS